MCSAQTTAPTSSVFTSLGYQEDEVKLDASSDKILDDAWDLIIKDKKHYVPSYNSHVNPELPEEPGLPSLKNVQGALKAPRNLTKTRNRYYFDTRLRDLFRSKVEVRLELKDGAFKQVIKMGNGATEDNPMMGRPEYPSRLKTFKPDLTAIDRKVDERQATIEFLRATVKGNGRMKPVIRIESQRRKLEYHPQGNRDITIEVGIDRAIGMNVAGFEWDIRQIELEIKENKTILSNSGILEEEMVILINVFPSLEVQTTSKPTPGFLDMEERKTLKRYWGRLPKDKFTTTEKFPKLNA